MMTDTIRGLEERLEAWQQNVDTDKRLRLNNVWTQVVGPLLDAIRTLTAQLDEARAERDSERRHAEDGETLRLEEKRRRQAAEARLEELTRERDEAKATRDELQYVFDTRWDADMRAIGMWQQKTGKVMNWPDHADMVCFLLARLEEAKAMLGRVAGGSIDVSGTAIIIGYPQAIQVKSAATAFLHQGGSE